MPPERPYPFLFEAFDGLPAKPLPKRQADDRGSPEPERLADAVHHRERFVIDAYLYMFHT